MMKLTDNFEMQRKRKKISKSREKIEPFNSHKEQSDVEK